MDFSEKARVAFVSAAIGLFSFSVVAQASYDGKAEDAAPLSEMIDPDIVGEYLSADYANRNNDVETASKIFLSALDKDPDNKLFLENSYKLMLAAGEVDKAVELAERYLQQNPDSVEAAIIVATGRIHKGQFADAGEILSKVALPQNGGISGVDSVITPFIQLWTKVGEGKYAEALEYSKNMLGEGRVPSLFLSYQSALVNDLADNIDAAREGYSSVLRDDIVMPYHFIKAAGNFYERNGEPDKAKELYLKYRKQHAQLDHFSTALARVENSENRKIPERIVKNAADGVAEVLQEAVRVLYGSSLYNKGVSYLHLVLYLQPESDESKILLAAYYEEKGQYENAINLYKTIEKDSNFYLTGRVSMAGDLYLTGEKRKAVKQLKALTKDDHSNLNVALLTLADILRKDENYKDAAEAYSKIIDNIKEPVLKDWPVFFARGICNERAGNWKQAEADLLKALDLKPGQPEVLNYLGYSWIDRDYNINVAQKMVEKAVKARPNDAQIIDSMGWALYKVNDFDAASRYLERAAELIPYDAVINDHLGDVYWRQGRYNEARFQWNRVIRYHNNNEVSLDDVRKKIKDGLPALPAVNG